MEAQLANFIGSGMVALSSAIADGGSTARARQGTDAIRYLLRQKQNPTNLIEAVASRIVRDVLSGTELPRTKRQHLEMLPDVLALHGHVMAPRLSQVGEHEAQDTAAAMAIEIITTAVEHGTVSDTEFLPPLGVALLSALLTGFFERHEEFRILSHVLETFGSSSDVEDIEADHVPSDTLRSNEEALPAGLLATLTKTLTEWDPSAKLDEMLLQRKCREYREIVASITPETRSDEEVYDKWREAQAALVAGRIGEADRLLGEAETLDIHASEENARNAKAHLTRALRTRIVRGRVEQFRFYGRRAIGHYAAAFRYMPIRDKLGRWELTVMQAQALAEHGRHFAEAGSLKEAIQIYGQAQVLITPAANGEAWLETLREQGELTLALSIMTKRVNTLPPTIKSLSEALHDPVLATHALGLARIRNVLGSLKWRIGRANADRISMAEAADLKLEAIDALGAIGAEEEAAAIEQDLPELLADLDANTASVA